jgi:hypothetical protein
MHCRCRYVERYCQLYQWLHGWHLPDDSRCWVAHTQASNQDSVKDSLTACCAYLRHSDRAGCSCGYRRVRSDVWPLASARRQSEGTAHESQAAAAAINFDF